MSNPLYAFPASCEQTLRALARYPERTAFSWPGGSITYQGATDMIGRIQSRIHAAGLCSPAPASRFSPPTAPTPGAPASPRNCRGWRSPGCIRWVRWTTSCSSWRIPKRRCWWSTASRSAIAAANSPPGPSSLKTVFTLGPADYGADLLQAIEAAGSATARNFAGPDDIATLNYTGGTTGKSKGALRHHREHSGFASAILADFEIPDTPSYLTVAPISHVAGTKGAADADARRHRAHAEGF